MTSAFGVKREPTMKPDPGELNQEDERVRLSLKVSELERNLMEERHKFERLQAESDEIGKLLVFKETEKYRREMLRLNEHVRRLEEDLKTLREREMIDGERMKGLVKDIEMKDAELNRKYVEFKVEIRDLECAKRRAQDEALESMKKLASLKARESILVGEMSRLKEKANHSFPFHKTDNVIVIDPDDVDDEEQLPVRTDQDSLKRKCQEEFPLSTPEPKGQVVGSDGNSIYKEDNIASACVVFSKRYAAQSESRMSGDVEVKEPSTVAYIQSPISIANTSQPQVTDTGYPSSHERCSQNLSAAAYVGRITSSKLRQCLVRRSNSKSGHPSFTKTMIRSSVQGSPMLTLPTKFCLENLPRYKVKVILEDDEGLEFKVIYIYIRTVLSGGWGRFASAHSLEVGDTLTFELSGPLRFKVHIIKANLELADDSADDDKAGTSSSFDLSVPGVLTRRATHAMQTGKAPA